MPLDPQVESFLSEMKALGKKDLAECTPEEFREMMIEGTQGEGPLEKVGGLENLCIEGPAGEMPVRIYQPLKRISGSAIVYYHGGGWVGGNLDTHAALCCALANTVGAVVVAVDYRLAPEAKYPAAAEDAFAAYQWVCTQSEKLGVDPRRVVVCGDSAGGNLAAVVCLMARDRGYELPCGQVLIYPITHCDFDTFSYEEYRSGYGLTTAGMQWFWQHYLGNDSEAEQSYASPLAADSHSDLPPALVVLAEYDVLRTEGEQYAEKLQRAGVPTEVASYSGVIHGFISRVNRFDAARAAVGRIADWLQRVV